MTGELERAGALDATRTGGDSLIDAVDRHLTALSGRLPELVGHPDAQIVVHRRLEDLRRNLAVVVDEVERLLLGELPWRVNRNGREVRDRLVVPGVGVVEPHENRGAWVEVHWSSLLVAIFGKAFPAGLVDRATGESVDREALAALVLSVVSPAYMRASRKDGTGLVAFGYQRGDFATWRDGEPGVRIIYGEGTE